MKYIDAGKLKYEIERRNLSERYTTERYEEELYEIIDSLEDEQPVEYPTSTEMIAEWENNELPMLREKDFRGDAERMAYNAFMDGFAKGLGYNKK